MRGRDAMRTLAAVESSLKYDLWIIAAGRGTRMGNISVPKCLIEIDGKSNLQNTLDLVGSKFRRAYIVVSFETEDVVKQTIQKLYGDCPNPVIEVIPIESGGGDGKAVFEAYEKIMASSRFFVTPEAVIMWGDAHIRTPDIVDELISKLNSPQRLPSMIIPAVLEYRPYVAINTSLIASRIRSDMSVAMSADFIKYGEVRDEGWHDQSIFGVQWSVIFPALTQLRLVSLKRDSDGDTKFTTQSGELTFLNVIHYLFNIGNPAHVYETKFPLMGYNTPKELEKIKQAIKQ